jgi:hypothetical protein
MLSVWSLLRHTSGVTETLLQSHLKDGDALPLHFPPVPPQAWPDGKGTGLRARGGSEVDLDTKQGQLGAATIRSLNGNPCRLRYGGDAFANPARELDCGFVSCFGVMPESSLTQDGVHPDVAGNLVTARVLFPKLIP